VFFCAGIRLNITKQVDPASPCCLPAAAAVAAAALPHQAMAVFRTLVGFGIPGAVVAFNLLLELTPTRLRGMFAVGIEGFWTVGTILQAGFAFGLLNKYGWRLLVVVSTIPYGKWCVLIGLLAVQAGCQLCVCACL
jgi:hypothetical protein